MADSSLHPDLEFLNALARLQDAAKVIAHDRNSGDGQVDLGSCDMLTDAAFAVVSKADKINLRARLAEPDPEAAAAEQSGVDQDGDGEPIDALDFLLGLAKAARAQLTAANAILTLSALPSKVENSKSVMDVRGVIGSAMVSLDRLVSDFAIQAAESAIELADWTKQLPPPDRARFANWIGGLVHFRNALGTDSGIGQLAGPVLYVSAATRESVGGMVADPAATFQAYLDDCHDLARQYPQEAQALVTGAAFGLAAIVMHANTTGRLGSWFRSLVDHVRQAGSDQAGR